MAESLEDLAEFSIDDLLRQLADALAPGGSPLDPDHKRAVGLALLRGWFAEVRSSLCSSTLASHVPSDKETVIRDAAAVTDMIGAMTGHGVPLATFSVLVVKYGLAQLCAEDD
jgi:hypothetical protein